MKNAVKNTLFVVLFLVLAAVVFSSLNGSYDTQNKRDLGFLVRAITAGEVQSIVVEENSIQAKLKDESTVVVAKEPQDSFSDIIKNFSVSAESLANVSIEVKRQEGFALFLSTVGPYLFPILILGFLMVLLFRQIQGVNSRAMSFGQSTAKETHPGDKRQGITFADVAGSREAKEELAEIVEFLRSPKKFIDVGAKIPKGVLLMGPPGTGKTLLARAVAGEANVPFFHVSGSEFVEMFVGVGASRVRSLFAKAKKSAPSILFIDELDALGRQRGAGVGGPHDEREQTLNQILVEMDGFEPNAGVIVIAATNRPDVLDRALLRPGRFDRKVVIDAPDIKDREEILAIHAKGKPLDSSVRLREVAERTPGFTGADLENVLNEAAILAARNERKVIGVHDIFSSIEKVLLGPERKNHIMSESEKKIIAYHEAGHALVAHMLPAADPVHKISVISRGRAGGYTLHMPESDRHLRTYAEYEAQIAVALGGYVAEKIALGSVTDGASSDLRSVTRIARTVVTEFGMNEKLGPRAFGQHDEFMFLGREITAQRDYSEHTAQLIDTEVGEMVRKAYGVAEQCITTHREKLNSIVSVLLEKEVIERGDLEALIGPKVKMVPA